MAVEVDVDVAWPSRLAELRVPLTHASGVVERLLGTERARQLVRVQPGAPRRLDGNDRTREEDTDTDTAFAFALGALAHQLSHDPSASVARQAAALLEAAVLLAGDPKAGNVPSPRTEHFHRGPQRAAGDIRHLARVPLRVATSLVSR